MGLCVEAGGIGAGISAHYSVKVGSGWFSVTKSGSVSITASATSASLALAISQKNGKPYVRNPTASLAQTGLGRLEVSPGSCSAKIGHLGLHFSGDLIDDIINQFSDDIADYIKGKLAPIICDQVRLRSAPCLLLHKRAMSLQVKSLITNDADRILAGIPTSVEIASGYHLDYSLTSNPVISDSSATVPFLGRIWQSHPSRLRISLFVSSTFQGRWAQK